MKLQVIPTRDYAVVQPFGVKGLAELFLRAIFGDGTVSVDVEYSPATAQSLRNAAKKLADEGITFTFDKCGDEYREVAYAVTRTLKNGEAKTIDMKRQFLICDAIRVTSVQNEATAAIEAAEASELN